MSKHVGEVKFLDDIKDKDLFQAKEFLTELSTALPKKCEKYFNATKEQVYIYSEIQLHTILAPIIDDISDAYLLECPTDRIKPGDSKSNSGWIDYWVLYKKNVFLMELKYSYSNIEDYTTDKKILKEWSKANEQLEDIPKVADFSVNEEPVIKIALQFNLTYDDSKLNEVYSLDNCIKIGKGIKTYLNNEGDAPNFIFNWSVDESMIKHTYEDGSEQNYPYIHLLARVYKD
ncbi:hypothetical protein [Sulfurimonas sp.]|uniref:hypothetical protein n=1 Tax=Sulfurimonas sp. TaxID=2022749 RepID=UPI00356A5C78